MALSFPALIAEKLKTEKFALLDIGCSGGLDPMWRAFEPRLRALGIDASEGECRRLAGLERNPDVSYVAAFVSTSATKPIDLSAGPAAPLIMKMRDRMSFMRTREIREGRLKDASAEEQFRHNAWELTGLADPGKPVVVPDLLAQRGWTDLDYLKIDIDGADFEILQSFKGRFDALGVIAVQLEVNFRRHRPAATSTPSTTPTASCAARASTCSGSTCATAPRAPCPPAMSGRRRPKPCRAGRSRARPTTRATCWRPIAPKPARD